MKSLLIPVLILAFIGVQGRKNIVRDYHIERERDYQTVHVKYGLSPLIEKTIDEVESSGNNDAVRLEAHKIPLATKLSKTKTKEDIEGLASSHSKYQIMGYTALQYGVDWRTLKDKYVAKELALAIFAKNKERCAKNLKSATSILWCAAKAYNGTGPKAEAHANKFMRVLVRNGWQERKIKTKVVRAVSIPKTIHSKTEPTSLAQLNVK